MESKILCLVTVYHGPKTCHSTTRVGNRRVRHICPWFSTDEDAWDITCTLFGVKLDEAHHTGFTLRCPQCCAATENKVQEDVRLIKYHTKVTPMNSKKPTCLYLQDGTKIQVVREGGAAWLQVVPQDTVHVAEK